MSGSVSGIRASTEKSPDGVEGSAKGLPVQWNGEHWDYYKALMTSRFEEEDLEGIVNGTTKAPNTSDSTESSSPAAAAQTPKMVEWKKKQATIKRLILGSLSLALAQRVMRKTDGTEMWKTLVELFEKPTNKAVKAHQQRQLVHQLWPTRARKDDDMTAHLGKMYEVRARLATFKYIVHDIDMVDAMLGSLPRHVKYQQLSNLVTLNASATASVDDVRDLILIATSQLKEENLEFSGGRTIAGNNRSGDAKAGKTGNSKSQQQQQQQKKPREVTCFHCHKTGHIRKNCPEREAKESSSAEVTIPQLKAGESSENVQYSQTKVESGIQSKERDSLEAEQANESYNARRWVYDTGSSGHVVGSRTYFVTYQEFKDGPEQVKGFASGVHSNARGFGVIALVTDIGDGTLNTILLEDVAYVPNLNWNLFSVGQARKQGFVEKKNTKTGECKLFCRDELVLQANVGENNVWTFQAHNAWINDGLECEGIGAIANFTVADGVANIRIWHARLGHTCAQTLKQMVDKELVHGMIMKGRDLPSCITCEVTKQKRSKRESIFERDHQGPNDVFYVDLMDPGKNNRARYTHVLVIVDGYSRWTTVHMLSSKTEVGDQLKDYVTWAERQLSRPVRKILSDSGTEFVNAEVKRWCSGTGIEWVTGAPGGSSVNYAERAIQTLRNSMKSMLKHSGLPLSFWPDALRTACYVRNRVVCNSTMRTPFELFYNKKPDVHRIRTFGALTYAHIPKDLRIKSADTSDVGFLLGYSEENMGSKVYFPQYHTARMVYTVRVNEDILYRDRNALPSSIVGWIADQHSVEEGESESIEDSVSESDSDADNDMEPCESEVDSNDDRMSMKRPRVFVRPFLDDVPDDNEIETTEEIPAGVTSNNNSEYASEGNTVDSCDSNIRDSDADEVDSSGPGDAAAIVCGDNSDSLGDTVSEDEIKDALEDLDTNRTVEADDNTEVVDNSDYLTKDDDAYNEPVDIEEEIWGLEHNGQSATEQEVDIVQNMRSFSETPRHGEKHERESIIDRREDGKKPRYETRELKRPKRERRLPKYLEDYVVNATLSPTLIGKQWQASKVKIPRAFREAMHSR